MRRTGWVGLIVSIVPVLSALACDRAPSAAGLPEWTPLDHNQEQGRPAPTNQARSAGDGGVPALVEAAWRNQCATCHGASGHGDGPQGPRVQTADLSRPEWQSSVKDEEIARTIRDGKGRMPKFDLPDEVVAGLVARVRSFRGR